MSAFGLAPGFQPDGPDAGLVGHANAAEVVVGNHRDLPGAPGAVRVRVVLPLKQKQKIVGSNPDRVYIVNGVFTQSDRSQ
jgi:hypothetical protein